MSTSPNDGEGTGDEQELVRRLLGDLALTDDVEPPAMPPELAARLDAALAAEADPGDSGDGSTSTVVPLRRRLLPALVAAAAVVVVAGGATAVVVQQQGGSSADSTAAGSSAESADEGDAAGGSAEEPPPTALSETQSPSEAPTEGGAGGSGEDPGRGDVRMVERPVLSDATLGEDATRLVAEGEVAAPDSPAREVAADRSSAEGSGCVVPDPDRGAATFVSYDGDPSTLVVGPLVDGERTVEVLECGTGEVLSQVLIESGPAPGR